MSIRAFTAYALLAALAMPIGAFETDQYNLPPVPLADIGVEVSEYVDGQLYAAVASLNGEISRVVKCLETPSKTCSTAGAERKKLAALRADDAVAEAFYERLGEGSIFRSNFGRWISTHKFRGQPDRYKAPYSETIFVLKPSVYATLSPTVRLYGVELGIDKLDHFFQQGYDYYKIEKRELAKGKIPVEAVKDAIEWGKKTERTYFGLLASGVYSNADLYANYAGFKFYQGLTKPVTINGKMRSPVVELSGGVWQINTKVLAEQPLKPFISDHMNEAFNPSAFRFTLVRSVRREVKKHACRDWLAAYPDLTKSTFIDRSTALRQWHGEDYGYTNKDRTVSLADVCFESDGEAGPQPARMRQGLMDVGDL